VQAGDFTKVRSFDTSYVEAMNNAAVTAKNNSHVDARMDVKVATSDRVIVDAIDRAQITAADNATVEAFDAVHVKAGGNSVIYAHDGTSVDTGGNAHIHAFGNAQIKKEPQVSLTAIPASRNPLPNEMNTAEHFEKNYIALANTKEFKHNPIHAGRLLIKNAEHGNREKILRMLHKKGCHTSRDIREYLLKVHAEQQRPERKKPAEDYSMER
jgi:hypothetical protein